MDYLVLVVLLSVMQASPPVPREAGSAGTSQTVQVSKSSRKPATPSSPVTQAVSALSDRTANPANAHQKDEKTVDIGKLHSISVSRDAMDYVSLVFTFTLLVVGLLGVRAAYRTLKAIESQAGVMRGQLGAMQEQVGETRKQLDMMINKERARIMVEIKDVVLDSGPARVQYTVSCHGPTEAFIKDAWVSVEILPSAAMDVSKSGQPMKLPPVMKNCALLREAYALNKLNVTATDRHQVESAKLWVHFKAEISYNDVFEQPRSVWSGEVYGATTPPMQNLDGSPFLFWMPGGEAYNRPI